MRAIRCTAGLILMLLLAACGGGSTGGGSTSGNGTGGGDASVTYQMRLALEDKGGDATVWVRSDEEYRLVATVTRVTTTQAPGFPPRVTTAPAPQIRVVFTADGAKLTPSAGTALTDNEGRAVVMLRPSAEPGAYLAGAKIDGGSASAEAMLAYQVAKVLLPRLTLEILGQDGPTTQLSPGVQYDVRVLAEQVEADADGTVTGSYRPAAGHDLTISSDGGVFDPTTGMAKTDAEGVADGGSGSGIFRAQR